MSQGNWGGGSGDGWGGQGGGQPPGGGYGPPGGSPPGGGGYGPPPGGAPPSGGYSPPGGAPPSGGGYGGPPPGGSPPGGYGSSPGGYGPPGGGYGPPGGGYGAPPGGYGPPGGGFAPPPAGYPPGYTPQGEVGAVPWEDASKGIFGGGWETFKEACFNPKGFFAGVAQSDNPWPAITFGMATNSLAGFLYGVFISIIYLFIGGVMASALGGSSGFGSKGPGAMFAVIGAMGVFAVVLYPVMFAISALITPWISGGVYHLMLVLFRGATKPYTNTVRVTGYSNAATMWMVIPGIGGLVSLGFHMVLTVIGLDETHKCGMGKAVAAVLVPVVLLCGCCCFGYGMIFAALGSKGHF